MPGTYKTVLNKGKFSRITAISIGGVLSVLLILFGWFSLQGSFTRASDDEPRDVVITNITSTSAQVEWTTGIATQGVIEYGTAEDALVFFAPETQETTTHSVELTLLTPATTHYFQIKIGDKVFTNSGTGKPWQFTTRTKDGQVVEPTVGEELPATGSAEITETPVVTLIPTGPTSTPSATPTITRLTGIPASPTNNPTATSVPISCNDTDCQKVKQRLGLGCTATDYIRCLNRNATTGPTSTPGPTATTGPTKTPNPTPTGVSVMTDPACHIFWMQASNSCTTWTWDTIASKPQYCRDGFYRYVFRCKNESLQPTPGADVPDVWYFDGTITNIASNSATVPGANMATPASGSKVYCAIYAEDQIGGGDRRTTVIYNSATCN